MATIYKYRDAESGKHEEVVIGNVEADGSIYLIDGDYKSGFHRVTIDGNITTQRLEIRSSGRVWEEVKVGRVTPDGVVYQRYEKRSTKAEDPEYREYQIGKVTREGTVYEHVSYADGSSKDVAIGKVDGTSNIYYIGAGAYLLLKQLSKERETANEFARLQRETIQRDAMLARTDLFGRGGHDPEYQAYLNELDYLDPLGKRKLDYRTWIEWGRPKW